MKKVTKERIVSALKKTDSHRSKRYGKLDSIARAFALYGMRNALAESFNSVVPEYESDRVSLEINLAGIEANRDSIESAMEKWYESWDRTWRFKRAIFEIQKHHKVSGLDTRTASLGLDSETIEYPWEDESISLIPEDLEILKTHKDRISQYFLKKCRESGYKIWMQTQGEDWEESCPAEVEVMVATYGDWCDLWESEGSIVYNLRLGAGLSTDSADCCLCWWCAAKNERDMEVYTA